MVQKIDIHQLHRTLEGLGIPVDDVHRNKDGTVEIRYLKNATDEQKKTADQIVAEWDQPAVDAKNAADARSLPSVDDINMCKSVADLKTYALALREYIDQHGR